MNKHSFHLTLVTMVATLVLSTGTSPAIFAAGFDKNEKFMYATLRESIYSLYNKNNITKKISEIRKGSNEVRALAVSKIRKIIPSLPPASIPEGATADVRYFVKNRASRAGWNRVQWKCLDTIIYKESRWHPNSKNKKSSAYGLFQRLKMPVGSTIRKQTEMGIKYIKHRYPLGPCQALQHHLRWKWY